MSYLNKDVEQAYRIAQSFSDERALFSALNGLFHKGFDGNKLDLFFFQAYQIFKAQESQYYSLNGVKRALEYFKLENKIQHTQSPLEQERPLTRAMNLANRCKDGLTQVDAWREIAKVYEEANMKSGLWETEQFQSFLNKAKRASEDAVIPNTVFKAHLALAKAQHLCGEYNNEALAKAYNLLNHGIQDADLLALAYSEIGRADMAEKILRDALIILGDAKSDDALSFIRLANALQKQGFQANASLALKYAFEAIQRLPESSVKEINSKVDLLEKASCCKAMSEEQARGVLESLELLYKIFLFGSDTKKRITRSIFDFCKRNNFAKIPNEFFESCLSDLTDSKRSAFDKINELAQFATHSLTDTQRTRVLEAAEGFVSDVPDCNYLLITTTIAEAYLGVNPAKSRELLDNYTNSQAKVHLLQAVAMAIALTIFRSYPMVGLFCSAAIPLISQLRVHRF